MQTPRIHLMKGAHLRCEGPAGKADTMRLSAILSLASALCALTVLEASAQTQAAAAPTTWARYARASEVQLRDFAGYVRIYPESRTDVAVSVANSGPLAAPVFRIAGARLIVDGGLRRQIRNCRVGGDGDFTVTTSRQGNVSGARLPVVSIRVPRAAVVTAGGAVRLHMADSDTARVRLEGCGDADVERVAHGADIALTGSADLRLYEADEATVAVAGAGDVTLGVVRAGLTASIAGSGNLTASRVDGPTNISVQGSGDVLIRDGRATVLSVAIAGSGDVTHNGAAQRLDAVILGSGDVRVREVTGPVSRRVFGGGDVVVGR